MRRLRLALMTIAGLMASLALPARAEETTGSVRGHVTLTDYPLPRATVTLYPDAGKSISARLEDGAFEFKVVPVGKLRVSVAEEGLPARYADPSTSGLSVRVKGGPNEMRLDLAAEGIEPGRPAPHILAYGPDGNIVIEDHLRGKYVVFHFWSIGRGDPTLDEPFTRLREIRREFARQKDLLIISLCINVLEEEGALEAWNKFGLGQGQVDYGDGKRRFIDDSRWWQCMGIPGGFIIPSAPRFGVRRGPETFLIGPDGRFVAVRIPPKELRREVAKAVERTP